jgi:hypothetical protein
MAISKKTSDLAARRRANDDSEPLDIVVELHVAELPDLPAAMSRAARLEATRENFERGAQPVIDAIHDAGGVVQVAGWLNGTLYARIDAAALDALDALGEVKVIDVPGEVSFPD